MYLNRLIIKNITVENFINKIRLAKIPHIFKFLLERSLVIRVAVSNRIDVRVIFFGPHFNGPVPKHDSENFYQNIPNVDLHSQFCYAQFYHLK